MSKENFQKVKLMKVYEYLKNFSDEEHPVSTNDIAEFLKKNGFSFDRRTIYSDIDTLNENGYEVMQMRGKSNLYYVVDRSFDVPEIKILIDMVSAAGFLTKRKTEELIDKISSLSGSYRKEILSRSVVIEGNRKHDNEEIYYTVDAIDNAIEKGVKVSFLYYDKDVEKNKKYRKEKARYVVSPVALSHEEDNYYLITYDENISDFRSFRLDRMEKVEEEKAEAEILNTISREKFKEFCESTFSMYSGKTERVSFQAKNYLVNAVLDRFGDKVEMTKIDEDSFMFSESVALSPTFFAWCFIFGTDMKILSPKYVAKMYQYKLKESIVDCDEE